MLIGEDTMTQYEDQRFKGAEVAFWLKLAGGWGISGLLAYACLTSGDIYMALGGTIGCIFVGLYATANAYSQLGAVVSGAASTFDEKCIRCGKRLKFQTGNGLIQGEREGRCRACGADQPVLDLENSIAVGKAYMRQVSAARRAKQAEHEALTEPTPNPDGGMHANTPEEPLVTIDPQNSIQIEATREAPGLTKEQLLAASEPKPDDAGWHSDPLDSGQLRYYNGRRWTGMVKERR